MTPAASTTEPDARACCLLALEERFGWLKRELFVARGGNIAALERHKQILWGARTLAIQRLNGISQLRDAESRNRKYRKLTRDLKRDRGR